MRVIDNNQIVGFDVDDTLILWDRDDSNEVMLNGTRFKVHTEHVEEIKKFHARGQYVIVWSAGGVEWASRVVHLLGIEGYVDLVMTKPQWIFDDKAPSEWMKLCYREHKA